MYEVRTTSDQDNSQDTTTIDRRFAIVHVPTGDVIETLTGFHTERPNGSVGNEGYDTVGVDGDELVLTDWDGKVTRRPVARYFVRTKHASDNPYGYQWDTYEFAIVHVPTGVVVDTLTGSYTERPNGGTSSEGVQNVAIAGTDLVVKDWDGKDTRTPLPERALVSDGEVVFGYADGRTVSRRRA